MFRIWGFGFTVWGLSLELKVSCFGLGVLGLVVVVKSWYRALLARFKLLRLFGVCSASVCTVCVRAYTVAPAFDGHNPEP